MHGSEGSDNIRNKIIKHQAERRLLASGLALMFHYIANIFILFSFFRTSKYGWTNAENDSSKRNGALRTTGK